MYNELTTEDVYNISIALRCVNMTFHLYFIVLYYQANELFEKLLTSHKRELSLVEDVDPDLWNNTWVGPLVDAVSSTNKNLKHNILQVMGIP